MPTLKTYRQRAMAEISDLFFESTAVAGSTTGLLADTTWPIRSTAASSKMYEDAFMLRPNAAAATDKVRTVQTYAPLTGHLTPDLGWTTAPYAGGVGEAYELHGVIDPWTALNRCINNALKRLMVLREFTLTPTANVIRHNLTTNQAWLINPEWTLQVGYLTATEVAQGREKHDPYTHSLWAKPTAIGGTVYINHRRTFGGTETLYIMALKPAYHDCQASPVTTPPIYQDGLSADTNIGTPHEDWVAAATLVEVWAQYGHILEANANSRLIRDAAMAAAWLTDMTRKYGPEIKRTAAELPAWGPSL